MDEQANAGQSSSWTEKAGQERGKLTTKEKGLRNFRL